MELSENIRIALWHVHNEWTYENTSLVMNTDLLEDALNKWDLYYYSRVV